ncbi:unnamed protein product [Echinostoma caproni]|uniref:Rab-GAP TBC domain-containing protein n=1 Tax=Echinostoma caproni TaxID=27848 RepID=A0A183AJC6_9TREM|nr:unnamed protein product [Echinostoma caproni]
MELPSNIPLSDEDRLRGHKSRRPRRQHASSKPSGRRGPGIFRPTTTELPATDNRANKPHHFKPSLTPGLGTIRVVGNHVGTDARFRFSTEPRAGDEAFNEWREAMRRTARLGDGLPKFVRRRVWSALAERQLATQHVDWDHVVHLAFSDDYQNTEDDSLGSQIVKDLHRTGCNEFGSDEDRAALKRVLLAYARWNKRVGYCQGFNMIAAAILDVMDRDEQEAFKVMVYLIDYVLPESYFAQNLQALSVDIAVFRHLLQARLPRLAHHLDTLQLKAAAQATMNMGHRSITMLELGQIRQQGVYEPPLMNVFIIQWFLTLFATCLSRDAVLRIWDSIMLEGSEVILRTAVVMMEFLSSRLLRLKSADQFYATMNDLMNDFAEGRIVSTQELLFEIYELAPFPYPHVKELREKFTYNIAPLVPENTSNLLETANLNNGTGPFRLLNRWKSGRAQQMVVLQGSGMEKRHKPVQPEKKSNDVVRTKSEISTIAESEHKSPTVESVESHSTETSFSVSIVKDELKEDEYQEISLSPNSTDNNSSLSVDKVNSTDPMELSYRRSAAAAAAGGGGAVRSEPCSDSDEDWTASKARSTSCFANMWPHRLRSIEPAPKHRNSVVEPSHLESISLTKINQRRKCSLPVEPQLTSSSPEAKTFGSDIGDLGPGAVGEPGVARAGLQTPLAHQARMSTNLTELKSIYRKQLARQRETTLRLPGLWQSDPTTMTSPTSCLSNACMTAVLPQNRESKQMTFEKSLDTSIVSPPPSPRFNTSEVEDDVFLVTETTSRIGRRTSSSDWESISEKTITGRLRRGLIPVDPDLVGAVQSWRAKAIWSCEPMPRESSGSESEVEQRGFRTHGAPITKATAPNIRLTLRQLAEQLNERERLTSIQSEDQTQEQIMTIGNPAKYFPHSHLDLKIILQNSDDVETNSSLAYESARSCPPSPSLSLSQTVITSAEQKRDPSGISRHPSGQKTLCGQNHTETIQAEKYYSELETASNYSSVSKATSRPAPWAAATASFVSRKTTAQRPSTINLPLPLSPKRRSFGAQFGMYKSIPTPDSARVWSNFCERVQTIGLQHRVVTR